MSCCADTVNYGGYAGLGNLGGNCCCNLPSLVILILIILQFSKRRESSSGNKLVDNGILFIIALFYLSCCNPCKGMY